MLYTIAAMWTMLSQSVLWLQIIFLNDAFRNECVLSITEFPVGVLGEVYTLLNPNSLANHVNCFLVNLLPLSLKIYWLPTKVEYTCFKYVAMCRCAWRWYPVWAIHYYLSIFITLITSYIRAMTCYVTWFLTLETMFLFVRHNIHCWVWHQCGCKLLCSLEPLNFGYSIC